MKNKSKTSKLIWEITVILVISIIFIASILADFSIIKIPDILALRINGKEDLLLSLFTTQATLSTISIAIIALASGVVSDSIFGISVTRYISQLKPHIFKHQRLITFSLIITFINFIAVSFNLFNTSIAFFFLSIVISIILVKDLFVIFLGKREIKNQIESYIIENYRTIGMDNFRISLLENENITSTIHLKENLNIIKKVFEKELDLQFDDNKSQLLEEIELVISDLFINLYEKKKSDTIVIILDFICDCYKISNSKKFIVALSIWDNISTEFFKSMKLISEEQMYNSTWFYQFHSHLFYNKKIIIVDNKERSLNCFGLKYYTSSIYYALIKNNSSYAQFNRKKLVNFLYEDLKDLLFYSQDQIDKKKKTEILREFCEFIKTLIEEGETEILNNRFFNWFGYRDKDKMDEYQVMFITSCVYLYYLACREDLIKGTETQKNAIEILNSNKGKIKDFLYYIYLPDFLSKNLSFVYDHLMRWEKMPPEEAKCLIIDDVINDFFVFTAIYICWNNDDISKIVLSLFGNHTFSIFTRYFRDDDKGIIKLIEEYHSLFFSGKESASAQEKSELLKDILSEKYKKEEIASGKENAVTDVTKNKFIENIKKAFQDKVDENSCLFEKELQNDKEYVQQKVCICEFTLPSSFINDSKLDHYIVNFIHSALLNLYIHILNNALIIKEVKYNDRTKQKTLVTLIKDMDIDADTFIGNRDVFWGEEDKELLKNFTKNMKHIKFPNGNNHFYLVDHRLVHCHLSDISVEFIDLSYNEIEKQCKKDDDGRILYNITNDIYIPFDKAELEEHIQRIKKKIRVHAHIHYVIECDEVGGGIQIVSD
ncbi:MAG: hypothetical protein HDT47_05280 [Ruminococcaceae bacterium]|nr:hypothetical protein [Oscillospiraceae bacterium]